MMSKLTQSREKSIKQEVYVLTGIEHRNIVTFVDCFVDGIYIYLVMELIDGQNLFCYYKKIWKKFLKKHRLKKSHQQISEEQKSLFYKTHKRIFRRILLHVIIFTSLLIKQSKLNNYFKS